MIQGIIGVIHLPPLPGDPAATPGQGFLEARERARADARHLAQGGVQALLVENLGSAPFPRGTRGHRLPPHQVATLALVAHACREETGLRVGVNCLRNDAVSAVGIAAAAGLAFVRVNVHVGAYLTDSGVIEGEADRTMRYRKALGAGEVALLADVRVKHAVPLAALDLGREVEDCLDRGLADGLIVTGSATGAPVSREELVTVRAAAKDRPVYLGSGVTPDSGELAALADGAIVGTWVKEGGQVHAPVDPARVRALVEALRGRFRGGP